MVFGRAEYISLSIYMYIYLGRRIQLCVCVYVQIHTFLAGKGCLNAKLQCLGDDFS